MNTTSNEMFILNDTAKNDPAVQIAMQNYMQQLQREEDYRQKVRAGIVTPKPTTSWNISDRDWWHEESIWLLNRQTRWKQFFSFSSLHLYFLLEWE